MSWTVSMIGRPAKVAEALDAHSETMTGQSRTEYDAALPHLKALVLENFSHSVGGGAEPCVRLEASGYRNAIDTAQTQLACSVKLDTFYATLLV